MAEKANFVFLLNKLAEPVLLAVHSSHDKAEIHHNYFYNNKDMKMSDN